jgi:hypothetical protein
MVVLRKLLTAGLLDKMDWRKVMTFAMIVTRSSCLRSICFLCLELRLDFIWSWRRICFVDNRFLAALLATLMADTFVV